MRNPRILYIGLILAAVLAALNVAANEFYLYWKDGIFGFDTFMHFLGGLTLGVLAVWFLNVERKSAGSFLAVFAVVMILGGVWEVFEYVYDIAVTASVRYWPDTIHDLVMDALGAATAYFLTVTSRRE